MLEELGRSLVDMRIELLHHLLEDARSSSRFGITSSGARLVNPVVVTCT